MLSVSNKIPQQYIYQLDGDGKITGKQEIAGGHFTQMDTVNFKEYYEAKLKERQAELAGAPELPRITLDVPMYEFYPTGDPVKDQEIQLGINYKKTCFDWTNSYDYDKLTAEEDFTGMSKLEKYKAIWEKYKHCYGEDFYDAYAIIYTSPDASDDGYHLVQAKFANELKSVCGELSTQLYRDAFYSGMNDSQIVDELIKKYGNEDGSITIRGLHKLTYAMGMCGIGGSLNGALTQKPYMDELAATRQGKTVTGSTILKRESWLDELATTQDLKDMKAYSESLIGFGSSQRINDAYAIDLLSSKLMLSFQDNSISSKLSKIEGTDKLNKDNTDLNDLIARLRARA